jgi:hypothetical protein
LGRGIYIGVFDLLVGGVRCFVLCAVEGGGERRKRVNMSRIQGDADVPDVSGVVK